MLNSRVTAQSIHEYFEEYYAGEKFIKVMPFGKEADYRGFLGGNGCSGWDGMEIYVILMLIYMILLEKVVPFKFDWEKGCNTTIIKVESRTYNKISFSKV